MKKGNAASLPVPDNASDVLGWNLGGRDVILLVTKLGGKHLSLELGKKIFKTIGNYNSNALQVIEKEMQTKSGIGLTQAFQNRW